MVNMIMGENDAGKVLWRSMERIRDIGENLLRAMRKSRVNERQC